jgi:hypothetical protein
MLLRWKLYTHIHVLIYTLYVHIETCICTQRKLLRWKLALVEGIPEPYTITKESF